MTLHWSLLAGPALVAVVVAFAYGMFLYFKNPVEDVDIESITVEPIPRAEAPRGLGRVNQRIASQLAASIPRGSHRWLQRQVNGAGRPDGMSVDSVLLQVARWLLLMIPVALLLLLQGQPLLAVAALALAFIMPLGRLTGAAKKRREQINRDLPSFLDVLAVTVSAGLAFRRALATVAERFGGPLGEEIMLTLAQIDNGATVRTAFRSLRVRTGAKSVEEFVTAYLQAEELGAPLAASLNEIATEMRRSSAQALRQQAARVEPRVSLITTTVMVPAMLILLVVGILLGTGIDLSNIGTSLGGG